MSFVAVTRTGRRIIKLYILFNSSVFRVNTSYRSLELIGSPKTSVSNQCTAHNNPEDGRINFNSGGSLRLHLLLFQSFSIYLVVLGLAYFAFLYGDIRRYLRKVKSRNAVLLNKDGEKPAYIFVLRYHNDKRIRRLNGANMKHNLDQPFLTWSLRNPGGPWTWMRKNSNFIFTNL